MSENKSVPAHASDYFPHVDGLRALAVLGVILYHLNPQWLPSGFAGVDIFFVISGFVVTASLASRTSESLGSFLAGFYARRLTRIVPALIWVLLASVLMVVLFVPQGWLTGFSEKTAMYAFFGFSNYLLASNSEAYFTPRAEFNAFTHTWSLGVEEQFYLVAPTLLFGWFYVSRKVAPLKATGIALLLAVIASSLVYAAWAQSHAPLQAFYSLFSRFWELAAGALLFQLSHETRGAKANAGLLRIWTHKTTQNVASLFGAALLVWSFVGLKVSAFPWPSALIPVVAAVLLIGGAGMDHQGVLVRRLLAHRLAVIVGLRSYSLYLWHWPVFVLMRWTFGITGITQQLAAIALTVVCAEVSYRFIELPIRGSSWLRSRKAWLRIVIFVLAIVVAAGATRVLFKARPYLSMSAVTQNKADWYSADKMTGLEKTRLCRVERKQRVIGEARVFEYLPHDCPAARSPRQLFVLGDSHATAYLMMFDQLAAELGATVRVYTVPGCPYVDLFVPMGSGRDKRCIVNPQLALKDALALLRPSDIVFLPSLRIKRLTDQWARFDEAEALQSITSADAVIMRKASVADAKDWIEPLSKAGADIVFELPKPVFRSPPFRCSDWFNASNEVCAGGMTISRADIERFRAPSVASMTELAAQGKGISLWDPLAVLCPGDTCLATLQGRPLFFDGDHVSAFGNQALYPSFRRHICNTLAAPEKAARCVAVP